MSVVDVNRSDWHTVQCPRVSTAPLRFVGRLLDERHSGLPGLNFALYERQQGGLTGVFPGWARGQWRPDALRANGWGDLFEGVERRCTDLVLPATDGLEPATRLRVHLKFKAERDRMLEAAGHALDHWQRLADTHHQLS